MLDALYLILFVAVLVMAVGVVLSRNAVYSAVCLIGVMIGLAGIFLILGAEFVAAFQILVYAGAIMVLFLFVIMMLNMRRPEQWAYRLRSIRFWVPPFVLVLLIQISVGVFVVISKAESAKSVLPGDLGSSIREIAQAFLTRWLLPFELTSVLLLVAIVGAVAVAYRREGPPKSPYRTRSTERKDSE